MATILIIDDDPDILLAARMCLEGAGHQVMEARSGKEGLEMIQSSRPNLIILDVMMETKTEGFRLALKLRNPDPTSEYAPLAGIPILMLTAIHTATPMRFEPDSDYLPVELFVDKPIDPDVLVEKVEGLLARAASSKTTAG